MAKQKTFTFQFGRFAVSLVMLLTQNGKQRGLFGRSNTAALFIIMINAEARMLIYESSGGFISRIRNFPLNEIQMRAIFYSMPGNGRKSRLHQFY